MNGYSWWLMISLVDKNAWEMDGDSHGNVDHFYGEFMEKIMDTSWCNIMANKLMVHGSLMVT